VSFFRLISLCFKEVELSIASDINESEDLLDISDIGGDTNILDLDDIDQLKITVTEGKQKVSVEEQKIHEKNFIEKKASQKQEIIDDFIRNYLIKHKMKKTL